MASVRTLTIGIITKDERGREVTSARVWPDLTDEQCDRALRQANDVVARIAEELGDPTRPAPS